MNLLAAILRGLVNVFSHRQQRSGSAPASAPAMRAVAVVISGPNGPIEGARVVLEGVSSYDGRTNGDGYLAFAVPASVADSVLRVEADGFKPYRVEVALPPTNYELRVGSGNGAGPSVILPALEPARAIREGIVALDGRVFVDGAGPHLAVGASLFWGLWAYQHDRDKLVAHLDWLAQRGVDYIRVFGVIGPRWPDRQIDPRDPNWDQDLAGLLDLSHDQFGLRVELTIWQDVDTTPTPADRLALISRIVGIAQARPAAIQYVEICNEGYADTSRFPSNWSTEAQRLATTLRAQTPHIVAVTSPGGMDPQAVAQWYGQATANLVTAHLPRDVVGGGAIGAWRYVRQVWDPWIATSLAWTNDEGKGPQSSVAEDADPMRLTMYAALTWLCGGAGFVLHTGAGVSGAGERGRVTNLWESANIEAILAGIRAARRLLPSDLPNWTRHNANAKFPQYPFDVGAVDAGDNGNMLRAFAATRDRRVVCMPIVVTRPALFQARWPLHIDVYDPLTGALNDSADGAVTVPPCDAAILVGAPA
jgi:hypothetical protein